MNMDQDMNDFNLEKIFKLLWDSKYLIIFITSFFAIISIYYTLQMPNKYKSSALIMIVDPSNNNSNSSLLSRFGGLATMAGISIPSADSGNKINLAEETIKSRDFFNKLVEDYDILPDLYASKNYNKSNKKIIYNDLYNGEKRVWNKSNKNLSLKPSNQEAYRLYRSILSIGVSDKSGYMTLSVIHVSPVFANKLITLVVSSTNSIVRQNDLIESETALTYLKNLMAIVEYSEIKDSISNLIEAQLETQMLVNIREDDYLLKYIDHPFSPEDKFSPRRSLYVLMATILGFLLGVLIVLYKGSRPAYKH